MVSFKGANIALYDQKLVYASHRARAFQHNLPFVRNYLSKSRKGFYITYDVLSTIDPCSTLLSW